LGQVSFVFSDKTGTLTQNKLEFLKFSVGNSVYGKGITDIAKSAAMARGETIIDEKPVDFKPKPDGFQFYDNRIENGEYLNLENSDKICEMFLLLSICHDAVPEKDIYDESNIIINSSNPDEFALIKAAKNFGYLFCDRDEEGVATININGKDTKYKVLATLPFNSTRKRMSVVIQDLSTEEITLYSKGADSIMLKLLSSDTLYVNETTEILKKMSETDGLRTLICAKRKIDNEEFKTWYNDEFEPAITSIDNRDKMVDNASAKLEIDLELIGATGIEDKIQDGVGETIEKLLLAGIRFWVLTGDKRETAINIGYACAILNNNMEKIILESESFGLLKSKVKI
jgi:magnesium-transporting ATPase (P-type)